MAKKNIPYDQKYYDPEIECMPRAELEAMQLERLQEMVRYAYDNTVYYKRSFDEAGVKPEDIKTLKDLEKFSSNLRGVLGYIKYSKDKKELSRFLNNSQMILRKNKLVIIIILVEKQL